MQRKPRRMISSPLGAFAGGACGGLAFAPFYFFPALFTTLWVAVRHLDRHGFSKGMRNAPLPAFLGSVQSGFWLGFGYFLGSLWWLGLPFLHAGHAYWWMAPIASLAAPAGLALSIAAAFGLASLLWSRGVERLGALVFALAAADWIRGEMLYNFPCNTLGLGLGSHLWLAQPASVVGLYGLSALAVAIFALPAMLRDADGAPAARRPGVAIALGLAGLIAWSDLGLLQQPPPERADVHLRLLQTAIGHDAPFGVEDAPAILDRYLALSAREAAPGRPAFTHLFWPENAFPLVLDAEPDMLARIAGLLGPGRLLTTGASRFVPAQPETPDGLVQFHNSVETIDGDGVMRSVYDKFRLVPFGEYVPWAEWLGWLPVASLSSLPNGFTPAPRRSGLDIPDIGEAIVAVCYEAEFPASVAPLVGAPRASLILNPSSDAWISDGPGLAQHFAQSRLRAIEQGLPMLRVSNVGASAVIDARGRIVAMGKPGRDEVLDAALPGALEPTFYSRYPNTAPALCLLLALAAGLYGRVRDAAQPRTSTQP